MSPLEGVRLQIAKVPIQPRGQHPVNSPLPDS